MVATQAPPRSLRRRVRALHRRLYQVYGRAEKARLDPLDELMLTILSQSTSDGNRDRAYAKLRHRYPTWEAVRRAARQDIEDAIRSAGLWKQKARVLQETLDTLLDRHGSLDLWHLEQMSDSEVIDYLTGFRGVGVKTAACVLCFSLERNYMPVDTHVHRLSRRLGLIPERATAEDAHKTLNGEKTVPPELRFSFHIQLIRHGRSVCHAGRPVCDACALADLCPKVGL